MLLPALGFNSLQGDSGKSYGLGLRVGLIAGARLAERWSLNVGIQVDTLNADTMPGASISAYQGDFGLSPLYHLPQPKYELVAGPVVAAFVSKFHERTGTVTADSWGYGWTFGANLGMFVPVGARAKLGGLANFSLRDPTKVCTSTVGVDDCRSTGLLTEKVLSFALSAML